MKELIEIVFENINLDAFKNYLIKLCENGNLIKNLKLNSSKNEQFYLNDFNNIFNALIEEEDIALFVNLKKIKTESFEIKNLSFQIIKYNNQFVLHVIFDVYDLFTLNKAIWIDLVFLWSKGVSKKIKAENFFSGLEPAEDEDTRIFSKEKKGPLVLKI